MSGKQQYPDEVYDRIAELYKSGKPMATIQNETGVARNTVYLALAARGVEKRRAARNPEAPISPDTPYDKLQRVPETPCGCGKGCGLTFRRVIGQRSRKYAPDCPHEAERRRLLCVQYSKRQRERARQKDPPRNTAKGRAPDLTPRRPVKICKVCYNLEHARAIPGCKGCGMPHVSTPSLKDHDELALGAANKWQALDIETEEKIVSQYRANRTIKTISKNCDVDYMSIYRVLRDYGVELRTK